MLNFEKGFVIDLLDFCKRFFLNVEAHIIYVNGQYQGDDPINDPIDDFHWKKSDDMKNKILAERARYIKESYKGIKNMCEIMVIFTRGNLNHINMVKIARMGYNLYIMLAKPFIKWVGGKSQLLEEIREKYPSKIEKYCEPFVGGGAILFDILSTKNLETVLINDINKELINTYSQIKNNCDGMISQLSEIQEIYKLHALEENKAYFYKKRQRYNDLKVNGNDAENLEKAALFIFLNKTCFNGLYRVNSKGLFNVPFNNAKNPLLCDEENLRACSTLLQNVEMKVGDYKECKDFIDSNTFVYIDPPYRPLTQTAAFTSYSENGFTDKEQIELGNFIIEISNKGAMVVASNSDPKNSDINDDFFDNLYSKFEIERVPAARMINSNAKKRGAINELLISNIASVF